MPEKNPLAAPSVACFESDARILRGIFPKSDARTPIVQWADLSERHIHWWKWFPETMASVQKTAERTTSPSVVLPTSDQKKLRDFFQKHPPKTMEGWVIYQTMVACPPAIWKKAFYAYLPKASLGEFKSIFSRFGQSPHMQWNVAKLPLGLWIRDNTQKSMSESRSLLDIVLARFPDSQENLLLARLLARTVDATIWDDSARYMKKNAQEMAKNGLDIIFSRARIVYCVRNDLAHQAYAERFRAINQKNARHHASDWIHWDIYIMRQLMQEGHEAAAIGDLVKARHLYQKAVSIPIITQCEKSHEAHWNKGFIYFVGLRDYTQALHHFTQSSRALPETLLNPKKILKSPPAITRIGKNGLIRHDVRALFWCGLCCEHLQKPQLAKAYYRLAADYGNFLYGKWASWKLNKPAALHFASSIPDSKKDWLNAGQKEAILIMNAWQSPTLNKKTFPPYSTTLPLCKDIVKLAITPGDHAKALQLIGALYPLHVVESAKMMAKKSHLVFKDLYPIVRHIRDSNRALVHSIILAESCFKPSAFSWDSGMGMMQIMMETAETAAKKMGIPLDVNRLRKDEHYQIQMGTHILNDYLKSMGNLYPPGIASYNAGILRATEWVNKTPTYPLPEDGLIWAESIPFQITRHYVLTVMESYDTYRQLMGIPMKPAEWVDFWKSHAPSKPS